MSALPPTMNHFGPDGPSETQEVPLMVITMLLSSGGIDVWGSFGAGGRDRMTPRRVHVGGAAAYRRPESGC